MTGESRSRGSGGRIAGRAGAAGGGSSGAATSEADDVAPPETYALTCTDCAFETTVEGGFLEAFDAADIHRQAHGDAPTAHFVNLVLNGSSR